ncbi:MAG: M1 family peptidase [Candidatus Atribacteria bacterium]|nr:MAG: M1 family peptidase [Candidatus Atribacteria bacterium]
MRRAHKCRLVIGLAGLCFISGMAQAQGSLEYDINLTVDYEAGSFEGHSTIVLLNETQTALPELFFRLFANDSTLYGSASLHVSEVSVQTNSMPFVFFSDDTILMVPLEIPLQPEESLQIEFSFSGKASTWPESDGVGSSGTGYGLLTKSSSALTMTTFYPMLAIYSDEGWALDPSTGFGDTLMGDSADYTVAITSRTGLDVVASGDLSAEKASGPNIVTRTFLAAQARDFSAVLMEEHIPLLSPVRDGSIRTWFSAQHHQAGQLANEMAVFSFQLYEELVGPSAYRTIELVEVPLRSAAGVEFSGLILIGSQYAEHPEDAFFPVIISHEIAHQWFYAGVGNDVSEHPWLDESVASYLSYEFSGAYFGDSVARQQLDQWRATYQSAARTRADLSIASPRYAFPDSSTYSSFVYSGGATFLHALRTLVGDEAFYKALQTYYHQFLHSIAAPSDLFGVFEETCACTIGELLSAFRIMP